jgi:hypothetical protein
LVDPYDGQYHDVQSAAASDAPWVSYRVPAHEASDDRRQGASGFIEPGLATSIEKVPSGNRWIHEIRFDGYRVQLHITAQDNIGSGRTPKRRSISSPVTSSGRCVAWMRTAPR